MGNRLKDAERARLAHVWLSLTSSSRRQLPPRRLLLYRSLVVGNTLLRPRRQALLPPCLYPLPRQPRRAYLRPSIRRHHPLHRQPRRNLVGELQPSNAAALDSVESRKLTLRSRTPTAPPAPPPTRATIRLCNSDLPSQRPRSWRSRDHLPLLSRSSPTHASLPQQRWHSRTRCHRLPLYQSKRHHRPGRASRRGLLGGHRLAGGGDGGRQGCWRWRRMV